MIEKMKKIFFSREFRLGLGSGLIIASMLLWNRASLSDTDVEIKARELGMKYEWELRAGEVSEND